MPPYQKESRGSLEGQWHTAHDVGEAERAGFACSEGWKVNGDHLAKYLMCGYRADGARVLPYQVQTKQIRGNGQNMQNKKFLIDNQRIFFTMKVVKHWNRLPRVCCRISSPHRHPELIWA